MTCKIIMSNSEINSDAFLLVAFFLHFECSLTRNLDKLVCLDNLNFHHGPVFTTGLRLKCPIQKYLNVRLKPG